MGPPAVINRWPLREIVARKYYRTAGAKLGSGSVELSLSCGHTEFRKRSGEPHVRARCWDCHMDGLGCDLPEGEPT